MERTFSMLTTRWQAVLLRALDIYLIYLPSSSSSCILHILGLSTDDILEEEEEEDKEHHEEVSAPGDLAACPREHDYNSGGNPQG